MNISAYPTRGTRKPAKEKFKSIVPAHEGKSDAGEVLTIPDRLERSRCETWDQKRDRDRARSNESPQREIANIVPL